jgi:aminoglycoside phosphotransferase (APT) family kinase protein
MQFDLLKTLGEANLVTVPGVLWFEEDAGLLGQPFFVMERMFGRVPVSMPVYNASGWLHDARPAERRRLWESAVGELARIHRVPTSTVSFLGEPDIALGDLGQLWTDDLATLDWSAGAAPHPVLDDVRHWLETHMPVDTQPGLAWGDARIGNMMFGEDFTVVAVMDWEQASLGGGLTDLGWWLFFDEFHSTTSGLTRLDGLGSRSETIAIWEEQSGLRARDLLWYEVLAGFRLSMFPLQMRNRPMGRAQGVSPEDNEFLRRTCGLLDIAPPAARVGTPS